MVARKNVRCMFTSLLFVRNLGVIREARKNRIPVMDWSDLSFADLTSVSGFSISRFTGAIFKETVMPDGRAIAPS